jgi:hypothetical protein
VETVERPSTLGHHVFTPLRKEAQHFGADLRIDGCQALVTLSGQSAVARASSPSFLRALPVDCTRTRAESLGGTSTTDSSAATNLWARCLP